MMSKSENILAFEAALKENKELQEKFEAAAKRIVENKEASSDSEVLVKAAAEIGFTLTMEELERAFAQIQELNEEELENVAGGAAAKNDDWCAFSHHCYIAFLHTYDGSTTAACWDNYNWFSNK
jgi:predicted ribosomally synthesized peptide with nif11-like leader